MKKHYVKPSVLCVRTGLSSSLLQTSVLISKSRETEESFVRLQSTSTYNVWDDDWSQEGSEK